MNIYRKITIYTAAIVLTLSFWQTAKAQNADIFTGTIISYNGPRLRTASFTLRIKGITSDEQASAYLGILEKDGQKKTLEAITKNDLGSLSVENHIGPTLNVVRESEVDGKRRIFVVFDRWNNSPNFAAAIVRLITHSACWKCLLTSAPAKAKAHSSQRQKFVLTKIITALRLKISALIRQN